jgi:hypothetical protein
MGPFCWRGEPAIAWIVYLVDARHHPFRSPVMARSVVLLVFFGATALAACGTDQPGEGSGRAGDSQHAVTQAGAPRLDPGRVPSDLRHLLPMAERWGIGDDVDRIARVDRSTPAEREELRAAVEPHHERITAWLNSLVIGQMSDEAGAFMYMQLALEEMHAASLRQAEVSPKLTRPYGRTPASPSRPRETTRRKRRK